MLTVALHEFGHTVSLGESTVTTTVMYQYYEGVRQTLTSDDISGVDSAYGTGARVDLNESTAVPITLNGCGPGGGDRRAGRLGDQCELVLRGRAVRHERDDDGDDAHEQPQFPGAALTLYSSAQGLSSAAATTFGGTWTPVTGVTAGQTYYIRGSAATTGTEARGRMA